MKKRHYHLTSAPGDAVAEGKDKATSKETSAQARKEPERPAGKDTGVQLRKDGERYGGKDNAGQTRKETERPAGKDATGQARKEVERPAGKDSTAVQTRKDAERPAGKDSSGTQTRKDGDRTGGKDASGSAKKDGERARPAESQRVLRSSVDEVIEATITRFSSVSPASSTSTQSLETGQRTVIVTPKKRHRVEEEVVTGGKGASTTKQGASQAKTAGGKAGVTGRPTGSPATDKGGGKAGSTALAREGVIKSIGNTEPKRRSGSRSSSLSNKDGKVEKASDPKIEKVKRTSSKPESKSGRGAEKMQTRSAAKPMESNDPSKTEPLHIDLPLLTIEAIKVECPNSDSLEMATLTPATDVKEEAKSGKQPAAGIFEPSEEAVEIDSSILVPLNSPSEMGNILKGSLSLKKIKVSQPDDAVSADPHLHKLDPKGVVITKNKKGRPKSLQNLKDVRVNLAKLSSSEFLLKKADEIKKKSRRRKFINRTGFPSSKKKKKRIVNLSEAKTVVGTVILPKEKQVPVRVEKHSERLAEKLALKNLEESQDSSTMGTICSDLGENSSFSDRPLSEWKLGQQLKSAESTATETDDELPLKQAMKPTTKTVQKISSRIEEKLNAGRMLKKRALKRAIAPDAKKAKLERPLRTTKHEEQEVPKDVSVTETIVKNASDAPKPAPVRKRKRSSTIKNTKSKMKSRYQLPLLSMKKFKPAKDEEKAQRFVT